MPVMPNDPAVPLWVLNTVPNARNRESFSIPIRLNAALGVVMIVLSVFMLYSSAPNLRDNLPWFIFLSMGISSLLHAIRSVLGRRWLDQHQQWAAIENLKWAVDDDGLPRAWLWYAMGGVCILIFLAWQFIGK